MKSELAINGGPQTLTHTFPWPVFDENEVNAITAIVKSGQWGNPDCSGMVQAFENTFAAYCGSKYGLSCVNGSVALRLALIAAGVKPGDEVIVPPYTFIATASIVLEANCVPVFVDIEPDTYTINPEKIEEAITSRTRVIIPVHFAGQACNMDAIMKIARRYNLIVIEDVAHAHGGVYKGKKLGSIGHAGCFSFQSSKNMTAGEGGIVITNDAQLHDRIDSLRNVGRISGGEWYEHHYLGCNYRITQLQAALLLQQLKRLDTQTHTCNANGIYLNSLLRQIEGITPLTRGHGEDIHTYHLYIFKYHAAAFGHVPKKEFAAMLAAEGIPCFMGYPKPLYQQPVFQQKNFMCYAIPENVHYTEVHCPVAEKACCEEAVWILHPIMLATKEVMEKIAAAIRKIQQAVINDPQAVPASNQ